MLYKFDLVICKNWF